MATLLPACNKATAHAGEIVRLYQCPAEAQALTQGVVVYNRSGADGAFTIWIVRGADERYREDADLIAQDEPIAHGERRRVQLGLGLQPGDTIAASATVAGVNFAPSVQEVR